MKTAIIHLSDYHHQQGREEDYGVVLDVFFRDLAQQISRLECSDIYMAFSGDFVHDASVDNAYNAFFNEFDSSLNSLGILKDHRICVPGNHDVSRSKLQSLLLEHEGIVSQNLSEHYFNDYVSNSQNVFTNKFSDYVEFEPRFSKIGAFYDSKITGAGWQISEHIGIYCLNTALCSSGGLTLPDDRILEDKTRLAIDTRSLHFWNRNCDARCKILLMHHPINWLVDWAERELRNLLRNNFALCISGHSHDQSTLLSYAKGVSLVECSAPPLFTNKSGELGYAIISLDTNVGVTDITYRQWTKHQSFVSGGNFSNTDDGKVIIAVPDTDKHLDKEFIDRYLNKCLDDALISYSSQPKLFVKPILSKSPEIARDADADLEINLHDFISNPKSTIIKAPAQFGLTCLAHYLRREAWRLPKPTLWLYLNSEGLKPNATLIEKKVDAELKFINCNVSDIKCVILDSWTRLEKDSEKLLQKICSHFKDVPIIVMQTIDEIRFLNDSAYIFPDRQFDTIYLWALSRSNIREIVSAYNDEKHIGDEDLITKKVVSDLEVLNLHRTPLNCLTLLKVSEVDFDESPVNRSEMIKRVLFLLFNVDDVPTYKARPDLKDSEYVLGYFCETMIRENNYVFTREHFLSTLQKCCTERFIDLEIQFVFDVLNINNILVKRGNLFCFKFSYWIFYFAAQRMHHDKDFAKYIFEDMRYANYPEIIEFYTGIDRQRDDALNVLIKDIQTCCSKVQIKCGMPAEFNPYKLARWTPSPALLEQMQKELSEGVQGSNLPASVKDHYADRHYDRTRPYDQDIQDFIAEYSFVNMIQSMKAGARALRNSDYVDPDTKRKLLQEIMHCLEQTSKVLIVLVPYLAEKEYAIFEGTRFVLRGNFGDTPEKRLVNILNQIPINVVQLVQEDLFSKKMGPLLIDRLQNEEDELTKHELILLLINTRPRDWKTQVHKYISSVSKNSFYLLDVYISLRAQYRYAFVSPRTLNDIEYLIRMAAAKHATGSKIPGVKLIKKVLPSVIPPRNIEQEK